jgi:hypothetical protein
VIAAREHALHLLVISALVVGMGGIFAGNALAAGTLTRLGWATSNNQATATNATYSFSFTTATTGIIAHVAIFVGSGPSGTATVVANYGIGAGAVARVGNTITYTVTAPVSVAAGTPILLELGGNNNNNAAIGNYQSYITTETNIGNAIDGPDFTPIVPFSGSNTAKTVVVVESTTFTLSTASFQLNMDPTLAALADQSDVINLTVQTNANSGYTLTVADSTTGLQCSGCLSTPTIPVAAPSGSYVSFPVAPAAAVGYTVTSTGATIPGGFSAGTRYTGYSSAGLQIASSATSTGASANTIAITDQTAVDYAASAGAYADTITFTVTPNYS